MKIKIIGAAGGEVTGSAYYVQTKDAKVLVDAGMFQGGRKSEAKNRLPSVKPFGTGFGSTDTCPSGPYGANSAPDQAWLYGPNLRHRRNYRACRVDSARLSEAPGPRGRTRESDAETFRHKGRLNLCTAPKT